MATRGDRWDGAMAAAQAAFDREADALARRKAMVVVGWHLSMWVMVLAGIGLSLVLRKVDGAGWVVGGVAVHVVVSTAYAWRAIRARVGRSAGDVVAMLLGLDGVALVLSLGTLLPDVPVALGAAVLPVVGLAVVGGGRASVALAVAENILLGALWYSLQSMGASPLGLFDVVAFGGLSLGAALLATVGAKAGFGGVHVLREEIHLHTRHLQATNTALVARNEALEHFSTEVGHDLRTPLQTTLLALHLVVEECETDEEREHLGHALAAVERLQRMTEGLLDSARDGQGAGGLGRVGFDGVVADALGGLAAKVQTTGARIEVAGTLPEFHGNRGQMVRVVLNLIDNAIKYGKQPTPRIRVCGGRVGEQVFLEVEDDGPGVPRAMRARIFEDFAQLETGKDGVGAGLAAVERVVAAHGGRIAVSDGRRLGGALFRIVLPAVDADVWRAAV